MNKILAYISFSLLLLSSCVNGTSTKQPQSTDTLNYTCHIDQYFSEFMSRFPDGLDNDIKRKRMNKVFVTEITDSLKKSNWLLDDYPLRFEGLKEGRNGLYRVHFQSWIRPHGFKMQSPDFKEFAFDIVAEIPEKDAINLVDGEFYIVHGHLNRFISHSEYKKYTDDAAYTPDIEITNSFSSISWLLGEMLFDIDSISAYND